MDPCTSEARFGPEPGGGLAAPLRYLGQSITTAMTYGWLWNRTRRLPLVLVGEPITNLAACSPPGVPEALDEIGEIGESDRVELTSVAAATEPSHRRCRDWDAPSPAVEQVLVADLTA